MRTLIDDTGAEEDALRAEIAVGVKRLHAEKDRVDFLDRLYGVHTAPDSLEEILSRVSREGGVEEIRVRNTPKNGEVAIVKYHLAERGKLRESAECFGPS